MKYVVFFKEISSMAFKILYINIDVFVPRIQPKFLINNILCSILSFSISFFIESWQGQRKKILACIL